MQTDADLFPDLRHILRHATADEHARLDARVSAFRLDAAPGYRAFLAMHGRILPAVERALEAAGVDRLLPDWQARSRRDALAADLIDLDMTVAPEAFALPLGADAADLAGTAYVLEGSRLGNRLIRRGLADGLPSTFLDHGDPGLWPSFMAHLRALPATEETRRRAVAAANDVFAAYRAAAEALTPAPDAPVAA